MSVLAVDLDHFKRVNDAYGHPVGDRVLVSAAERMSSVVRAYDRVGRLGGEEFVIVIAADVGGGVALAHRLCTALRARCSTPLTGRWR